MLPNDQEVLFLVLLVTAAAESVAKLNVWVDDVLQHESAYLQQGLSWEAPADWKNKGKVVAPIFKPIDLAYGYDMTEPARRAPGLDH